MSKLKVHFGYSTIAILKVFPAILVLYSAIAVGEEVYGKYVKALLYQGVFVLLITLITPQAYVYGVVKNEKTPIINLVLAVTIAPFFLFFMVSFTELKLGELVILYAGSLIMMAYALIKSYFEANNEHQRLISFERKAVFCAIIVMSILVFWLRKYSYILTFSGGYFALFMLIIVSVSPERKSFSKIRFSLLPSKKIYCYTWPLFTFNLTNYFSRNFLGFYLASNFGNAMLGRYGLIFRIANIILETSVGPAVRYTLPKYLRKGVIHLSDYKILVAKIGVFALIQAIGISIVLSFLGDSFSINSLRLNQLDLIGLIVFSISISIYSIKGLILNARGKNKMEIVFALVSLFINFVAIESYIYFGGVYSLFALIITVSIATLINTLISNLYLIYAGCFD